MPRRIAFALSTLAALVSLSTPPPLAAQGAQRAQSSPAKPAITVDGARQFVAEAEARLLALAIESQRAEWVKSTYITDDSEQLAALANQRLIQANVEYAQRATQFDKLELPADVRRKLMLLKLSITLPAPSDPAKAAELTQLTARMEGAYGKGKWMRKAGAKEEALDITALTRLMAQSRDARELQDAWVGWHAVGAPMRGDYMRYVQLGNEGARELGFADMGAMWRAKYDMPPDAFAAEVDRLWEQVKPFYVSLHAYVRRRLRDTYGAGVVPADGPIPAHLLGNMWAQEWANIYELVAPKGSACGIDLTQRLKAKKVDERGMVKYGENFFVSLGFPALPATFWERSQFSKPRDRDVVCHASAWDVDFVDDLRIKMCIDTTAEDFETIHHELGHNFYQRAYAGQPFLFRDSANDGFHEAIGDAIALSVTPSYLKQVGLIDREPPASCDIGLLLQQAMDKIAFLPFGLVIDQWRWKLFNGEITPENANAQWWALRQKYQGVVPPVQRTEADFDPGAKYHVPANVSYTRYFLARILQFQFHRAMCQTAGQTGALNRASIYGNAAAGAKLQEMLAMGSAQPWPDALQALTGERDMDARAILDYFAPLKAWLDEQNAGQPVGW